MIRWLIILNLLFIAKVGLAQATLAITDNLSFTYDTTIFSKSENYMHFNVRADSSISISAIKLSGEFYTKPNEATVQSQFKTFYNLLLNQQSDTFNIVQIDSLKIGAFPTALLHVKTTFTPEIKAQPGIALGVTCHFSDAQIQVIANKHVTKFCKKEDEKLLAYTTLFLEGYSEITQAEDEKNRAVKEAAQIKLMHWQDSVVKIYTVNVKPLPLENKYYYKNTEFGDNSLKVTTQPDTLGFELKPKYGHNSYRGQFVISPPTNLTFKTFDFDKESATGIDNYAIFRSMDAESLIFTLRHFKPGLKKMSGTITLQSAEGYTLDLPFVFEYYCGKEFEKE
jgi:hypothetical protein